MKDKPTPLTTIIPALCALALVAAQCVEYDFNNPYDPKSNNYVPRLDQFNPNINYGTLTDSRDGKTYKTVTIGTQTWMAENLNYTPASGNSWCYNNSADSCAKYGRLYDWSTAMGIDTSYNITLWSGSDVNHQGVCPTGWHLPSREEWTQLESAVGGSSTAGRHLKAQSGWSGCGPSGSDSSYRCEDTYGFSARPGGSRWLDGSFNNVGNDGYWWAATEYDATGAYGRVMYFNDEYVNSGWGIKSYGFSARCVRD